MTENIMKKRYGYQRLMMVLEINTDKDKGAKQVEKEPGPSNVPMTKMGQDMCHGLTEILVDQENGKHAMENSDVPQRSLGNNVNDISTESDEEECEEVSLNQIEDGNQGLNRGDLAMGYSSEREEGEISVLRGKEKIGLGRSRGRLKKLINKFNVDLLAISETFAAEERMELLGNFLNYHHFISNENQGGKLWLFWNDINAFEVISITTQMVSGWFIKDGQRMLVTFVYAKCSYVKRRELWRHLEESQVSDYPWLVLGDFNVIRTGAERIGGNPRPLLSMIEFNDCLHQCGLFDLLNTGQRMSWCNGHEGLSRSWAKLDRVLISNAFSTLFGSAHFKYLSRKSSDHCPFRFLNMWRSHDLFLSCVEDAWIRNDSASGLLKFTIRLKRTKVALRAWNKNVFGRVGENLQALEERMEVLENQLQSGFF
ncbi:hypothetical protein Dsin_013886 [Dipteronia sinensis]|uniref:Endonuclease/exonuclease/phosphatase domain-containing protein n=1 Tax=Dipteronia sinensis TaxID=43782 RepID=A0AAE0AKW8_9ROSI|nr:hypothetical protein Dsin_013886 [Dipteronia sinensis]